MTIRNVSYKYGTGNPVLPNGSTDVRDGIDNLQSLDIFMNSDEDTYNQRDGEIVKTRAGAVRSVGIQRIGDFTTGCTVTERNQGVLELNKSVYVWLGVIPAGGKVIPQNSTPQSTGGIGPDGWLDVGDASLRSDLSSPQGATLVKTSTGDTVEDALAKGAGTQSAIAAHNADASAHQQLSAFITAEADRAKQAADAAFVNADVYPDVATGRAAVADGDQFQVVQGDEIVRYRRDTPSGQTEVARYPNGNINSLTVNRGKSYPLRPAVRGGVETGGHPVWDRLLLDVVVDGATPGEIYRIAYQQNNALLEGVYAYDWIIQVSDKEGYTSSGSVTDLVGYRDNVYGPQQQLDPAGGVQTVVLYPTSRPWMTIYLTIDASQLPPVGNAIGSMTTSQLGGSWIIDPSCYRYARGDEENGYWMSNQGRKAPLKSLTRGGVVSSGSDFLIKAILDVAVVGARPGYYYGIRYFKNGVSVAGNIQDGWAIEEVLIDGFEESVFDIGEQNVVNIRDYAPDIDRSLGVQTIRVDAPGRDLSFYITLDPQYFPEFGTYVGAYLPGHPGYSWVIDPARYYHGTAIAPISPSEAGSLTYSVNEYGQCLISWKSGDRFLRWGFGPNGANALPNFSGIYSSIDGITYSAVSTFTTDWLPPLIFQVASEPEYTTEMGFTGGNHLLVGGMQTARNVLYKLYADGALVNPGTSGVCQKLTAIVVNEVMAANTVSLERYAARQSFAVSFSPGVAEVSCEFRALEDLRVSSDYGPQLVSTGFNDTQLFLDGQFAGRIAFDSASNSGPFSDYPDAWAVILQSSVNGQLASWLDHSYGVGNGAHVAPAEPRIRGGGGTSTKQYHAAIRNMTTPLQMAAGDTYQWRGGYALSAPVVAGEGFDSELSFVQDSAPRHAMIVDASDYVVLP